MPTMLATPSQALASQIRASHTRIVSHYAASCSDQPARSLLFKNELHSQPGCGKQQKKLAWHRVSAGRGRGGSSEDDVEFDDWDSGDSPSRDISGIARQGWSLVNGFANRLVDLSMDFAPDSLSRPVVDTVVRAGLVLLGITLVRGILGSILLLGTVVLGIYVATRVFGSQSNQSGGSRSDGNRNPKSGPFRRGRGLPSGSASSDLMDVWFEPKEEQRMRPGQRQRE